MGRKKKPPKPFTPQEEYWLRRHSAKSFRSKEPMMEGFAECQRLYKQNPEEYGRITQEVKHGIIEEIRGSFG